MRYDADNKMSMLVEDWVSKANSKQRRGRAGRVQKGRCYFMYSRRQEERLKSAPTPEIQLACLDQLCLQITGERRGEGEERDGGERGEGVCIESYIDHAIVVCPNLTDHYIYSYILSTMLYTYPPCYIYKFLSILSYANCTSLPLSLPLSLLPSPFLPTHFNPHVQSSVLDARPSSSRPLSSPPRQVRCGRR